MLSRLMEKPMFVFRSTRRARIAFVDKINEKSPRLEFSAYFTYQIENNRFRMAGSVLTIKSLILHLAGGGASH